MRITVCQLRDEPAGLEADWAELAGHCAREDTDLLLLPEMPFYRWLHATSEFDPAAWEAAVSTHESWLNRFGEVGAPLILGSRPVSIDGRRRNEGFVWSADRGYRAAHHKRYLPDEDGFWEGSWYGAGEGDFVAAAAGHAIAGFLICTELWFTEHAGEYAAAGVQLLASPRATEAVTVDKWMAGGRTAAVRSGAFGLSSNRSGHSGGIDWGGGGWILGPDGDVLAVTSDETPFATIEIDLGAADDAKSTYPRYVR